MEEKILIGFLIKQIHIAFETRCHTKIQLDSVTNGCAFIFKKT